MLQIVTGGGIRFSTMMELWGANKCGKSTTCYQSAGYFLEDYGDQAELKVLDSESSFDNIRMKFVFNIDRDDPRVEIQPAFFIEEGMKKIIDWANNIQKDKYMMIIWDTIAASPTKSSYMASRSAKDANDMTMWAGGQADRPRVIKHYFREIMSAIYEKNISIWCPNQVFSSMNSYGASEVSGEGSAFHHDIHYSLHFKRKTSAFEAENNMISEHTVSHVALTKSKFSPEFKDAPIFINNKLGGVIDERLSLYLHAVDSGQIVTKGGYYYWKWKLDQNGVRILDPETKGQRWNALMENDEVYQYIVTSRILSTRSKFPIIDRIYQVQGFPKVADYSQKYPEFVSSVKEDTIQKKFSLSSFLEIPEFSKEELEEVALSTEVESHENTENIADEKFEIIETTESP